MRTPRLPVTLLISVALVALAACSSDEPDTAAPARTTTTTAPAVEVVLQPGPAIVASAGPDKALDDATRTAVLAATQAYVDNAVAAPLATNALGGKFGALFDAAVGRNAMGADRAALADEGIGKIVSTPAIKASPVRFDALADRDGNIQLVASTFSLDVRANTVAGPIVIKRTSELTFTPSNGSWLITAYRVTAARDVPQGATTTTVAAS